MILPTPQSSLSIYFEGGRKEGGLYYSVNVQCIFRFRFCVFFLFFRDFMDQPNLRYATEIQTPHQSYSNTWQLQCDLYKTEDGNYFCFCLFVCLLLNVWVWFSIIWVTLVAVVVGGIVGFHMENRTKKKLCVKIFIFWLYRRLCFCLHSKKKTRELNIIDHQRENISTDDGYLANYGSNKSC